MPQSESEQKGGWLYVTSAEVAFNQVAIIKLNVPLEFDFNKNGKMLLKRIEEAVNLFHLGETNED